MLAHIFLCVLDCVFSSTRLPVLPPNFLWVLDYVLSLRRLQMLAHISLCVLDQFLSPTRLHVLACGFYTIFSVPHGSQCELTSFYVFKIMLSDPVYSQCSLYLPVSCRPCFQFHQAPYFPVGSRSCSQSTMIPLLIHLTLNSKPCSWLFCDIIQASVSGRWVLRHGPQAPVWLSF